MIGFLCALPLIATYLSACTETPLLGTGYVEGEYVLIAPVTSARIEELAVRRGTRVVAGDLLAMIEQRDAEIALSDAESGLAQAQSRLADLRVGRRDEEILVIEALRASAESQVNEAQRDADRQVDLLKRQIASQSRVDAALTELDVSKARLAEVEANLVVARLPARPHEIEVARATVAQAESRLDAAAWQLQQRTLLAPTSGTITEVLRNTGEIAGPQAPILSMLPDGAVLLRLYVSQSLISGIAPGTQLHVNCDGCPPDQIAEVTYVSDSPEFTPPVIYSLDNRQKLVYLIEARPDDGAFALKPGQIVDAILASPE